MTRAQLDEFLSRDAAGQSSLDVLDEREMEVISMMSQGSNSSHICRELNLEPEGLAALKKELMGKLRLKNEVQLIQFAAKQRSSSI
jgi:DNA-binding NarL/FixJ family response regulator